MTGQIFYITVTSFALGIFLRSLYDIPFLVIPLGMAVSFLCAIGWARRRSRRALVASIFLLALMLGVLRFDIATWSNASTQSSNLTGAEITITGIVNREPEVRERTTHLYLALSESNTTVLLFANRTTAVEYGDRLSVTGRLQEPEAFETDLGRSFNYSGYLEARGVTQILFYPEIEIVEHNQANQFLRYLFIFKHTFMDSVELLIPEPQAGLGEGLLLGVKSALGEELEEAFRRTGIIHIVVLSGYNVMLVVVFVMTILSFFLGHKARLPFGIAAITIFALLVGLSATVVRASIMASLILVARATGNSYGVLRALFFAGLIMLLFNPYLLLFDPGFQLSFVATMGLILLAPHLESLLNRVPTVIGIREFLVATLATQIFVLPLLLYQIGEFSVVSVLVNVLVLPMVPVAMLFTFISGMIGLVSPVIAMPFAYLTYLSLTYIISVATWFAALPFAAFVVPPFPFWLMVLMYVGLTYVLWRWLTPRVALEPEVQETGNLAGWTVVEETKENTHQSSS